jgi:hypothetical protein
MALTVDQIARVVHEANRAVQQVTGDGVVSRSWWEAPRTQRDGLINGIHKALAGASAEELHDEWVRYRAERGWKYGRIKDEWGKTHPTMVPFDELPPEQKVKDHLFVAIVRVLVRELGVREV